MRRCTLQETPHHNKETFNFLILSRKHKPKVKEICFLKKLTGVF